MTWVNVKEQLPPTTPRTTVFLTDGTTRFFGYYSPSGSWFKRQWGAIALWEEVKDVNAWRPLGSQEPEPTKDVPLSEDSDGAN